VKSTDYVLNWSAKLEVLIYSLILYPLISIAYWSAHSVGVLFAARLLHGLASAMMLPMAMTYVGAITPPGQEGRYMGIYNTFLFIAGGIGPLLGGLLASELSPNAAFLSLSLLAIGSLLLVIPLPRVSSASKEKNGMNHWGMGDLIISPGILALAVLNVENAVLDVFQVSFFPVFAQNRGLSLLAIGFLIAINSIVIGASQVPCGWLVDRTNKYYLVLVSGIVTSVLLTMFPLCRKLWVITMLMILIGFSSAITIAASSALSTMLGRTGGMGHVMGFLNSATSFGMIVGPIVSGIILDKLNVYFTFYFNSIVWLVSTMLFAMLWMVHNRRISKKQDVPISY